MRQNRTVQASRRGQVGKALFSFGIVITLAACGTADNEEPDTQENTDQPVDGGTLNIALSDEPTTLDATTTRSVVTQVFSTHITEQLFALDGNFEPQPMLVETYDLDDDGQVYTFTLRDGVFFHNGEELSANDVVASLERFRELSSIGNVSLEGSDISAADERTVTVAFDSPRGGLLSSLADRQAPIYPASILQDAEAGPLEPDQTIGTGPYQYEEWSPGSEVVLTKYEDYAPREEEPSGVAGQKTAHADELRFTGVPDAASRVAAVESGQYHIGEGFGSDDVQLIEDSPTLDPARMRLGKLQMINNTTLPPLDNPEIRRAIQVGLDVDAFGEVLGEQDNWNIAPSILPSDVPLSSDAGAEDFNQGDVDEAQELLEQAGYDGTPITIMTPSLSGPRSQAVVMQEQLEAMGVEASIDEVELTVMQTRRGDPDDGWNMVASQVSGQTDIFQTQFLNCDNSYSFICEDDLDESLDNMAAAITDEERQEAHDNLQESFYDHLPAYMLAEFWDVYAVHEDLQGFTNEVQPYFWNTWATE